MQDGECAAALVEEEEVCQAARCLTVLVKSNDLTTHLLAGYVT